MFWVLPKQVRRDNFELNIPDRVQDLIEKSWNEGLDSQEREELRLWIYDEEDQEAL
jgi:hypothetical protein